MDGQVFRPGAGHVPPLLAGRDDLLARWQTTLNAIGADGRYGTTDQILVGPRGIGKTAVLHVMAGQAQKFGWDVVAFQSVNRQPGLLAQLGIHAEERQLEGSRAWGHLRTGLGRISGLNIAVAGIGVGVATRKPSSDRQAAPAAAMVLARSLAETARQVRDENNQRGGLVISLDETQMTEPNELALLAAALHQLNGPQLVDAPVVFVGTGLPETGRAMREAGVTHPDRLFRQVELPVQLDDTATRLALTQPTQQRGVVWTAAALDEAVALTRGYPYHIQALGQAVWEAARSSPIDASTVAAARPGFIAEIDRDLAGRWEQQTDREREYLAALSVAGGHASSGTVAKILDRPVNELSRLRTSLIESGDIYAPRSGEIAMTMPIAVHRVLSVYEDARQRSHVPMLSLLNLRDHAARALS